MGPTKISLQRRYPPVSDSQVESWSARQYGPRCPAAVKGVLMLAESRVPPCMLATLLWPESTLEGASRHVRRGAPCKSTCLIARAVEFRGQDCGRRTRARTAAGDASATGARGIGNAGDRCTNAADRCTIPDEHVRPAEMVLRREFGSALPRRRTRLARARAAHFAARPGSGPQSSASRAKVAGSECSSSPATKG